MEINNSLGPIDIAISGLQAQSKDIDVISSNVANARTTNAGRGEPYRRLEARFKTDKDQMGGVSLDKIMQDTSDFTPMLDPGNPDADGQGYVRMPNVNIATEMINLSIATRTYQANAAVLKRYQQMVETSLELLR